MYDILNLIKPMMISIHQNLDIISSRIVDLFIPAPYVTFLELSRVK